MKKIICLITVLMALIAGSLSISADEYGSIKTNSFTLVDDSLLNILGYLPIDPYSGNTYHEFLNEDFATTFCEMITCFNVGLVGETESENIIRQNIPDISPFLCKVYRLDEIQQTFNAVFNTNIDMASLNGLKTTPESYWSTSEQLVYIFGNYFIVLQSPHGGIEACIQDRMELFPGVEYRTWYYDDFGNISDLTYAVISLKNVCGYDIMSFDYIGFVPPSEEFLTAYKNAEVSVPVYGDSFFQAPDYLNPFGRFALELVIGDYTYGCGTAWNLVRYNEDGSYFAVLAENTVNFITDGQTIYYSPDGENTIYKMNADGTNKEPVLQGIDGAVTACWNNKYLYYDKFSYKDDAMEKSSWRLDLQTGETKMIFALSPKKMVVFNGSLFYLEDQADVQYSNLYMSPLDGFSPVLISSRIIDFKIIDSEIYAAKCLSYYDTDRMDFRIFKDSPTGGNAQWLTDVIYVGNCQTLYKDRLTVIKTDQLETEYYKDFPPEAPVVPLSGGVTINGVPVAFDQPPVIQNGRTLVPLRAVFESLGCTVSWHDREQRIEITDGENYVNCFVGKTIYYVGKWNGDETPSDKLFDVSPQVLNGRTLVPIRAICEEFGHNVSWNEADKIVEITSDKFNPQQVNVLKEFLENSFNSTEIKLHDSLYTLNFEGTYFSNYQTAVSSFFADVDHDGMMEMAVTSVSATKKDEVYGNCLSIWDCDENGNVYMMMAAGGSTGRTANKYHIASYYGEIFLYETRGERNSAHESHYRCAYKFENGKFVPVYSVYFDMSYTSDISDTLQESEIDGKACSLKEAMEYYEHLDANMVLLYSCGD